MSMIYEFVQKHNLKKKNKRQKKVKNKLIKFGKINIEIPEKSLPMNIVSHRVIITLYFIVSMKV